MADLLIRAYPRWWRERYGQEYAGLLEELPAYPGTVINVLTAGANVRLRPPERHPHLVGSGGPQMIFDLGGWHSRTFAAGPADRRPHRGGPGPERLRV
jgi:hypothetical protein